MTHRLTKQERVVVDKLAEAWNLFLELPEEKRSDGEEFASSIHIAQRMILARPARRALQKEYASAKRP